MAGSGKFEETIGPNTEPKEEESDTDIVCGLATGSGCAAGERMTLLRGDSGPSCDTADEARRYAGIATIMKVNAVRKESWERLYC